MFVSCATIPCFDDDLWEGKGPGATNSRRLRLNDCVQ